jgi:flagellar motor switch protein FliN/FliY
MPKLSPDTIANFAKLQEQVWLNVATAVSHASEPTLTFYSEAPESIPPEAIRALASETALAIQFAFASSPDANQLVLISSDTFAQLASVAKGEEISEPDENMISDVRDFLEGVVQGICLACGIAKNEPMVASGLTLRFQPLSLPENFTRNEDLVKVEVAIAGPNVQGKMTWYIDNPTVTFVSGSDDEEFNQSNSASEIFGSSSSHALPQSTSHEESGGLDLLMDIPLEITVELGRVNMLVKDVVELGTGSIVEINKAAGEPVDVMVNGRLVARGEVVVIEDNFGVRITEILTAQERINKLGEAA